MRHIRGALVRLAAGLALAVLLLALAVQAIVSLAVRDVTDDYVRRFMAGTVELLREDLAALPEPARARRVRELDERFAYPVALADVQNFDARERERLAAGEMLVYGLNRRVAVALPAPAGPLAGAHPAAMQLLVVGPLDPDWNPEHRLHVPRELWLQAAVALLLAAGAGALAWMLLRPAWRDVRALQRAGQALASGRFDAPMPVLGSVLLRPLGDGLRATLERLAAALAAQRELTGAVSHELRTPLASLKALVDTLRDGALEDPPAATHFLERMEIEVDEMTQMVQELLELSRIESGQVPLRLFPTTIAALVEPVVERLQPQAERAQLTLHLFLESKLPEVLVDTDRIRTVLLNLLHNAIKFTPAGGTIIVRARLSAESLPGVAPDVVVISVTDSGIGIPAEEVPRIFERFYKADRARSGGGTGLGLAIAKHTVHAHNGQIWVESTEQIGSTFFFTLPLVHIPLISR